MDLVSHIIMKYSKTKKWTEKVVYLAEGMSLEEGVLGENRSILTASVFPSISRSAVIALCPRTSAPSPFNWFLSRKPRFLSIAGVNREQVLPPAVLLLLLTLSTFPRQAGPATLVAFYVVFFFNPVPRVCFVRDSRA